MPKKKESGLKGKYPHLQQQELRVVRGFFYLILILQIGALTVVLFDIFGFFETSYSPQALSFTGIFILVLYFLREGKKNEALNALLLMPIPAYFLMVSTRFAIFPPQSSYNYEIFFTQPEYLSC